MTPRERIAIELTVYPMIKDLKADQLKSPLIAAINTACGYRRVSVITGQETKEMADMLSKILKESFTTYRIGEVCKAIEMGALGELEEDNDPYTVSVELCYKWALRYRQKFTNPAKAKQMQYEDKIAKETQEADHVAKILEFETVIIGRYKGFPDSLLNDNYGVLSSYYRHLDKLKLLDLPIEKKKELFEKAKKIKETNESEIKAEHDAIFKMGKQDREERGKTRILKIEFTDKQIAEALALEYLFDFWQFEGYNLKEALQFSETK